MIFEKFSVAGKVAIVTGAARGIGKGIALCLSEAGANVVCVDIQLPGAEATVSEIQRAGREARGQFCDVTDGQQVEQMVRSTVKDYGRVDILVNNAGHGSYRLAVEHNERSWEGDIRLNLTSAFLCSKSVARYMVQQKAGSIVNISSRQAHLPSPGQIAYAAAKSGVNSLTRALAWELAPHVRVNAVEPGPVWTEETAKGLELLKDEVIAEIPRGRMGSVEDVALAVLYLASPASDWVTGRSLGVDGGIEFSARLTGRILAGKGRAQASQVRADSDAAA